MSFNCTVVCKSKRYKARRKEKRHIFTSCGLHYKTGRMISPDILIGDDWSSRIANKDVLGFINKHWRREDGGRCLIFKEAPSVCQTSADINYWEANIGAPKSPSGQQITPVEGVFLLNLHSAILLRGRNWKNWLHSSSKHRAALFRHQLRCSSV